MRPVIGTFTATGYEVVGSSPTKDAKTISMDVKNNSL